MNASGINWPEVLVQVKEQPWREDEDQNYYREVLIYTFIIPAPALYDLIEREASMVGLYLNSTFSDNGPSYLWAGEIRRGEVRSYSYQANVGPDDHYFYSREFTDLTETIANAMDLEELIPEVVILYLTATMDDGRRINMGEFSGIKGW